MPTDTQTAVVGTLTTLTTTQPVLSPSAVTSHVVYMTSISGSQTIVCSETVGTVTNTAYTVITTVVSVSTTSTSVQATTLTTASVPSQLPTTPADCKDAMGCVGQDIFLPVALGDVPANFQKRADHPVPRLGITNQSGPIETNKFYANFFLGNQNQPTFTHPYGLSWSKGSGNAMSWGLAVSQLDADRKVFGPVNAKIPGQPASYYINPLGIQSLVLSAAELGQSTVLTSDNLLPFSANINLLPTVGSSSKITFPVVQGMGFVTGLYTGLQPSIQSSVFFRTVTAAGSPQVGIYKYRLLLEDNSNWLLYAAPTNGIDPNLRLVSSTLLQGLPGFSGSIQVAKDPGNANEALYDLAAGAYATSATISGYADGPSGSYTFAFNKGGFASSTLLMFALPHHVQSLSDATAGQVTSLQMTTTTKGMATAILADAWTLVEPDLPVSMGFAPWRPDGADTAQISQAAIDAVHRVAAVEISQNMTAQSYLNSMYYSGKALSKFATLVWTVADLLNDPGLAAAGLANLKVAFANFVDQKQPYPLVYDTAWGGVVSSASYLTGDSGVDFGNSYYNDHHFHYGYHVHAASIIGALDPTWLAANKDYVNTLVRDYSNPSSQDTYFPFSRSFDWFHGHSWAKGLFESGDGKDQESTSEDAMAAYALKMWGKTIGDTSMEARGNMMLSIQARSFQNYFLMESNNVNQPSNFIGNKVTGILFENKIDHTTYFGANLEYIQG